MSRALRRRLALTTILAVAPFMGYGRQVYAACGASPPGPSTFECSGTETTQQNVNADNAVVSVAPGFSVDTGDANGVRITGNGHLQFIDENSPPTVINAATTGLRVISSNVVALPPGGVTIRTNGTITGGTTGIFADNSSGGDMSITANGEVTGTIGEGIQARNYGVNLAITTGVDSDITGGNYGIFARNYGTGSFDLTVNGDVTGGDAQGIYARNDGSGDMTIKTGAQSAITGDTDGIFANNVGSGNLTMTIDGQVTGDDSDGVHADNSGKNLTITTGAGSKVTGAEYGIYAEQDGTGDLTLDIYGEVTGTNRDGLEAINSNGQKLKITTGAQSIVTGGDHGIYVDNHGYGDAEITAKGIVKGLDGDGIHASNSSTSDNQKGLTITTTAGSSVTGSQNGIYGDNFGDLDLAITVNGVATGEGDNGIYARNARDGDTVIKVGAAGLVQGNDAGIEVKSGFINSGQDIFITNDGVVRNLSSEPVDRAITTRDGPARIDNNGQLVGTVFTDEFADTLNNNGLWNVAGGTSDFGDEEDTLNNRGNLVAARDATNTGETTVINGLEFFNNTGQVTLADGGLGDELQLNGPLAYEGQGGTLAVDVVLAPGGEADLLRIDGTTNGVTYVAINVTNPASIMPNTEGIAVAVASGATANGDFDAEDGVINAGFFAWDVRLDEDGHTHELYTAGFGAGAYEFAAGITALQDIWHQTNGTILQRQADLRVLLEGMGVTPVADFTESVAPAPVAKVTPGFWFRGVGAYSERDDEENGVILDRKQTTYGGLAGIDFGTEDVGDALMFGVFGGYIASDLDFDRTNTEWQFEGPTIGVYVTYLDHAFHADVTVKADFLDIDIDADDLAPGAGEADTDAFNIGGQIDVGYKIGLDHGLFVDPQASFAMVHTEVDDIDDILGGAVEFDDATSVRGRLGLRLGHETTTSDGIIYSGDMTAAVWQDFTGDNEARVFAPLTPATDLADDPPETYGDVSVGFNILAPDGWSGFLRANYLFAEDYDAISGNAGVRYAW